MGFWSFGARRWQRREYEKRAMITELSGIIREVVDASEKRLLGLMQQSTFSRQGTVQEQVQSAQPHCRLHILRMLKKALDWACQYEIESLPAETRDAVKRQNAWPEAVKEFVDSANATMEEGANDA